VAGFAEAAAAPPDLTAVLCVAREKDLHFPERLYHKVPLVEGHAAPPERLAEAVAWLRDHAGRHRALVCSATGDRRAPSVAVAYLCAVQGWGFARAAAHVAERHPGTALLPGLEAAVAAVPAHLPQP
jgi:protein-tyrosine phosphatase